MTTCEVCWGTGFVKGHGAFCPKGCKDPQAKAVVIPVKPRMMHVAALANGATVQLKTDAEVTIGRVDATSSGIFKIQKRGYDTWAWHFQCRDSFKLITRHRFVRNDNSLERFFYIPRKGYSVQDLVEYCKVLIDESLHNSSSILCGDSRKAQREEASGIIADCAIELIQKFQNNAT